MHQIIRKKLPINPSLCALIFWPMIVMDAVAVDNPTDDYMPVEYRSQYEDDEGCPVYITGAKRWFRPSRWTPANTGWCSHYTSDNNKYTHAHFGHGLPFIDEEQGRYEEVTAAKIETYYVDKVYKPSQGYIKIGDATCEYNCHGYAFGTNIAVHSSANGSTRFLEDAYDECVGASDIQYAEIGVEDDHDYVRHSIRVIPLQNQQGGGWGIGETREKSNASPIYKRIYDPPLLRNNLWKSE